MNLISVLDQAMLLEQKISECYETLSEITSDENLSQELRKLAHDEINHRNVIKTGKKYMLKMPELFDDENISEKEI